MIKFTHVSLFVAISMVLAMTGPKPAVPPQDPQLECERVPTARGRSDTFPRWQNPTYVCQAVVNSESQPAGRNPRGISPVFSDNNNVDTRNQAMSVDSRNIVHMAGIQYVTSTQMTRVVYVTSSPETRLASGFSAPVILAEYQQFDGPFGYFQPSSVDIKVDRDDNVVVTWSAGESLPFSGAVNGIPYQVTRSKRDIFSVVKTSNGWQQIAQLTTAVCQVDVCEFFEPVRLDIGATGPIQAAGLRSTTRWTWEQNQQGTSGSWEQVVLPPGTTPVDLCHWPNILAAGTPQVVESSIEQMGGFDISPSGDLAITYLDLDMATPPVQHVYCRRFTGAAWLPPFDVCGPAGGGVFDGGRVAFDSMNQPHFVFDRDFSTPTSEFIFAVFYRFNTAAESVVSLPTTSNIHPNVLIDSRDNVHVTYLTAVLWNNGIVWEPFYMARVKNPNPTAVNTTWRRQDILAAPVFEQTSLNLGFYGPTFLTGVFPTVMDAEVGRNDQIHCLWDINTYTCTVDYGLGVRDPAAMVPAFPGGAINLTNGNVHYPLGLFSSQGVEPTQSVSLIYNSLDPDLGSIAPGWRLNYDIHLIDHGQGLNDPGGNYTDEPRECMTLVLPDGRRVHFGYRTFGEGNADLGFLAAYDESGFFAKLERTSWTALNTNCELTFKNGDLWVFNSGGRLVEIRKRDGNIIALTYTGGRLQTIKDQTTSPSGSGRTTTIYYESQGDQRRPPRIDYIQDPTGKQYDLVYSGNELTGVMFPDPGPFADAPNYEFEYYEENDVTYERRKGLLRYLRTPRASAGSYEWACYYRSDSRCVRVQDPYSHYLLDSEGDSSQPYLRQSEVTVDYFEPVAPETEPSGSITPRKVIVHDRRGYPHRYICEARRNLVREIHDPMILTSSGEPMPVNGLSSNLRTFDAFGNLVTNRDRYGLTTTYAYEYTEPTPQNTGPVVGDDLAQVSRDDVEVESRTYTNDAFHQVQTITTYATPAGGGSPVERTTTFSYDSVGRLQTVDHPGVTLADGSSQAAETSYQYNGSRGALSRITDEEGHFTNFSSHHGVHGLPQSITREGGTQAEEILYDSMGNVTQHRKPQGGAANDAPGWTYYNRDNLYRVWAVSDPAGHDMQFDYDVDSNLVATAPPAGAETTYTYDARGFRSGGGTPDGSWIQIVDANGNVRRVSDFRQSLTNTDYDPLNRTSQQRIQGGSTIGSQNGGGPATHTVTYANDLFNNGQRSMTITQGAGAGARTTTQFIDSLGRTTATLGPDGLTRQEFIYNEIDQVLASQTRYNGMIQTCQVQYRDARDRGYRTLRQNAAYGSSATWSESTWTQFDKTGGVVRSIGPRGNPTEAESLTDKVEYIRDARGRVILVKQPIESQLEVIQESVYGDDDLIVEERVPNPTGAASNLVTFKKYAYTARKEIKSVLNADNKGLTYTYGALPGQVVTVTDAENRVTKMTYHSGTQRVNEVLEAWMTDDQRKTTHTWESGLLTEKRVWNPQSQSENATWTYDYDRCNRIERVAGPQMAPEVYRYDQFSSMDQVVAGQRTEVRTFDSLGQVTGVNVTGAFSSSSEVSYDGSGNMT